MRRYGISRPPNLSVGSKGFCNKTFRNRPRFNHWGEGFLVISCRPWALMAEGFYTRFNGVFLQDSTRGKGKGKKGKEMAKTRRKGRTEGKAVRACGGRSSDYRETQGSFPLAYVPRREEACAKLNRTPLHLHRGRVRGNALRNGTQPGKSPA